MYGRLKAVEVLLNNMEDVAQQLSDHEHSLLTHDTMSSDRDSLRGLHNQLRVRSHDWRRRALCRGLLQSVMGTNLCRFAQASLQC